MKEQKKWGLKTENKEEEEEEQRKERVKSKVKVITTVNLQIPS